MVKSSGLQFDQMVYKPYGLTEEEIKNMKEKNFEMWQFFNREVAKINTMILIYDQIFNEMLDRGKKDEKFLYLILDSFTRSIATSIYKFFDKREDSWSLYKFDNTKTSRIDKLKNELDNFIYFRHKSIAHLDTEYQHNDNFDYFTKYSIEKLKNKVKEIRSILNQISKDNNYKATYVDRYIDLESSFNNFMNLFKKEIR